MSGESYTVPPRSRQELREAANQVRDLMKEKFGLDQPYFPIVQYLDCILPKILEDYRLEVLEKDQMGSNHGLTLIHEPVIQIRQDVFRGAYQGNGRDRQTFAHELGHFLLHRSHGLARNLGTPVEAFRSSEWQANAFGGELLVSARYIHLCDSPQEASLRFGVSLEAAQYQWKIFQNEGLL